MTAEMTSRIDVSVVVAARNEEVHVLEALESIVKQGGLSHEIVFVDDHSEDQTFRIASDLAESCDSIRVFRNPRRGKCAAFNFGVELAHGRFVCIFAGDDIMPPGSLRKRLDAVAKASDTDYVVGLAKLVTMSDEQRYDGHLVPRAPGRGAISGVSPLMNRRALDVIFPVPEQLPNEDTWMQLAVLHMPDWKVIHTDVVCCQWRVHAGNSINYSVSFNVYNQKITIRMDALGLFMEKYGSHLRADQQTLLAAKVELEEARRAGRWWRVLMARAPLVDRLRALSITNPFMYAIRKQFYGLLSGW